MTIAGMRSGRSSCSSISCSCLGSRRSRRFSRDNPTWSGLGHGLLILATLWWAWTAYAWLTNTVDPEVGAVWGAMLVAMGAMFVAALAVPDAFGRHGVVFGIAFLIVNVMHVTLYALAARGDRNLLAAIFRYAPGALSGATLILAAGFVHGGLKPILWLAALALGLFGPLLGGTSGWNIQPAHFVERHGLIVIIAIGESLIAIGLGERLSGLSTGVIVAAVLGFVVATSFWLAYFDFFPIRGEHLLTDRSGVRSAPPSHATSTATSICRWWRASCSSRSR